MTESAGSVRRSPSAPARDQQETAFTRILADLVSRIPGARAVALVDVEGETVDYWSRLPPFDIKVAAAQWRVVVDDLRGQRLLATTSFVAVRAARASYQAHVLPEGYALVIVLMRCAGFGGWRRAVAACREALAREASWAPGDSRAARWYSAHVETDSNRRPVALGSAVTVQAAASQSQAVEVLGAVASGMGRRERGWRVRVANGTEATLVYEPGGNWYVDEPSVFLGLQERVAKSKPQSR